MKIVRATRIVDRSETGRRERIVLAERDERGQSDTAWRHRNSGRLTAPLPPLAGPTRGEKK